MKVSNEVAMRRSGVLVGSISESLYAKRAEIMDQAKAHGVTSVSVFGSVVRGEDSDDSDVDLLVEFEERRSLFDLIRFQDSLSDLLERPVDVVTKGSLNHRIRDIVVSEARPL